MIATVAYDVITQLMIQSTKLSHVMLPLKISTTAGEWEKRGQITS